MSDETEKRGPGRPRKRLPVRIVKGHWPASPYRRIAPGPEEEITGGKALRGWIVELDADEARRVVASGIAERADAF